MGRLVKQSQEGSLDLFFFLTPGDKSPKGKAQSKKETSGQKYQNMLWVQPSLFILTNYLCTLTFIIPLQLHKHNIIKHYFKSIKTFIKHNILNLVFAKNLKHLYPTKL